MNRLRAFRVGIATAVLAFGALTSVYAQDVEVDVGQEGQYFEYNYISMPEIGNKLNITGYDVKKQELWVNEVKQESNVFDFDVNPGYNDFELRIVDKETREILRDAEVSVFTDMVKFVKPDEVAYEVKDGRVALIRKRFQGQDHKRDVLLSVYQVLASGEEYVTFHRNPEKGVKIERKPGDKVTVSALMSKHQVVGDFVLTEKELERNGIYEKNV